MDVYNKEAVQAVWARVTASKEQSLGEFYKYELQAAESYRRLAMRFPKQRNLFLSLSRDEERHARQLAALYYMLFGCPVSQKTERVEFPSELCQVVRELYRGETDAVQRYTVAAEQFPSQYSLFTALAADEARHADRLLALMQTIPVNK